MCSDMVADIFKWIGKCIYNNGNMQKRIILVIICLYLIGCSFITESEGQLNDIFIFTSEKDKVLVQPVVENVFNQYRHTPQKEPYFNLKWRDIHDIGDLNKRFHLILVSLMSPADTTADPFVQSVHENQNMADKHSITMNDVYARNQKFISINAMDAIHLETILDSSGSWLVDQISTNINAQLLKKINSGKRNTEIEELVKESFGLSMLIQQDYMKLRQDSLKKNFLWLGRGVPYRWLTIHQMPLVNSNSSEDYWSSFEQLVLQSMPDTEISSFYRTQDFLPHKSIKRLKGVYAQTESDTGGPFTSYIFDHPQWNKTIFISGFVNNPGKEKLLLLNELELIISQTRFINNGA